jgi:hypothetical protein
LGLDVILHIHAAVAEKERADQPADEGGFEGY